MKITDFIVKFYQCNELENWLKKQPKDYLYSMYMEETNYEGVGYREITRNKLKDIFVEKYIELAVQEKIPSPYEKIKD